MEREEILNQIKVIEGKLQSMRSQPRSQGMIITPKFGNFSITNPQEASQKKAAEKQAEIDVNRSNVGNRLENIYRLSDRIPRGEGMKFGVLPNRFVEGAKSQWEAFGQSTERGNAAGQLQDSVKDILAPLARMAGDVGNLAEWEQKIRSKLMPSIWDSASRTQLKKAYLNELTRISNNPNSSVNEIDEFFSQF